MNVTIYLGKVDASLKDLVSEEYTQIEESIYLDKFEQYSYLKDKLFLKNISLALSNEAYIIFNHRIRDSSEWINVIFQELGLNALKEKIDSLMSYSFLGLLFYKYEKHFFIISFGYGHHLLNKKNIISDFGIKVILNSIEDERIRFLQSRTFQTRSIQTQKQSSTYLPLKRFGFDETKSIIQKISTISTDTDFGSIITGSDALKVTYKKGIEEFQEKFEIFFHKYFSDSYRENYYWLDDYKPVNKQLSFVLYQKIFELISRGNLHNFIIFPPDFIPWGDCKYILLKYQREIKEISDFCTSEIIQGLIENGFNFSKFKSFYLGIKYEGEIIKKWNILETFLIEINYDSENYLLINNNWYVYSEEYLSKINAKIKKIKKNDSISFVSKSDSDNEADYCNKLSITLSGSIKIHPRTITSDHHKYGIEPSDLIVNEKYFLFLKVYMGSNSIFYVSSQLESATKAILLDKNFRKKLHDDIFTRDSIDLTNLLHTPSNLEYIPVLLIIKESSASLNQLIHDGHPSLLGLPLLSKLCLIELNDIMNDLGVNLEYALIDSS